MKKLVSLFATALLMVSCNQEAVLVETPEVTQESPRPIGFDTFVDKSSRAAGENSTALNDFYPSFNVYGWKTVDGTTTMIFDNHTVNYVADETTYEDYAAEWGELTEDSKEFPSGWYYKNLRYWDKMASAYQFCAYAPSQASADVACTADGTITIGTEEKPVAVDPMNLLAERPQRKLSFTGFKYDYMTAVSTAKPSDDKVGKVSLTFQHLQAKLNVRIKLDEDVTTAQDVRVKTIEIHNLSDQGYYTNAAGVGVTGWTVIEATDDVEDTDDSTNKYVPAVYKGFSLNTDKEDDNFNEHYVIEQLILPQTIAKAASAEPSLSELAVACLYVEYTIGDELFKSFSPLANIFTTDEKATSYNLEGGKQYTINVIVGPAPIEFTVEVAKWENAVEANKEMN